MCGSYVDYNLSAESDTDRPGAQSTYYMNDRWKNQLEKTERGTTSTGGIGLWSAKKNNLEVSCYTTTYIRGNLENSAELKNEFWSI